MKDNEIINLVFNEMVKYEGNMKKTYGQSAKTKWRLYPALMTFREILAECDVQLYVPTRCQKPLEKLLSDKFHNTKITRYCIDNELTKDGWDLLTIVHKELAKLIR